MNRKEYFNTVHEFSKQTEKAIAELDDFLKPLESIHANNWTQEQLEALDKLNHAYTLSVHNHLVFCTENSKKVDWYS